MLSAYINSLVLWLYQYYCSYAYLHIGSSEAFLLAESILTLLESIHYQLYTTQYHFAEWINLIP